MDESFVGVPPGARGSRQGSECPARVLADALSKIALSNEADTQSILGIYPLYRINCAVELCKWIHFHFCSFSSRPIYIFIFYWYLSFLDLIAFIKFGLCESIHFIYLLFISFT